MEVITILSKAFFFSILVTYASPESLYASACGKALWVISQNDSGGPRFLDSYAKRQQFPVDGDQVLAATESGEKIVIDIEEMDAVIQLFHLLKLQLIDEKKNGSTPPMNIRTIVQDFVATRDPSDPLIITVDNQQTSIDNSGSLNSFMNQRDRDVNKPYNPNLYGLNAHRLAKRFRELTKDNKDEVLYSHLYRQLTELLTRPENITFLENIRRFYQQEATSNPTPFGFTEPMMRGISNDEGFRPYEIKGGYVKDNFLYSDDGTKIRGVVGNPSAYGRWDLWTAVVDAARRLDLATPP